MEPSTGSKQCGDYQVRLIYPNRGVLVAAMGNLTGISARYLWGYTWNFPRDPARPHGVYFFIRSIPRNPTGCHGILRVLARTRGALPETTRFPGEMVRFPMSFRGVRHGLLWEKMVYLAFPWVPVGISRENPGKIPLNVHHYDLCS